MPSWQEIWQTEYLGNSVGAWTLAVVAFLVTFTVLPLIRGYITSHRRKWAQDDRVRLHQVVELAALLVERTSRVFPWTVALYFASRQLTLLPRVERVLTVVIVVIFWVQAALWAMTTVRFFIAKRKEEGNGKLDPALAGSIELIMFVTGIVVWATAALLALANLGINVVPLLAGLGIGGIAIALAVQTVLGDLLASISIALDKPFAVGDFLILDNFLGTVEHIGVKSTRLRSLSGEQIIMSNNDILSSRVRNYGRMYERRIVFQIGVQYDTPLETLRAIPGEVRKIIEAQKNTRFDRCHFLSYGDSSLQFETVYYVLVADYNAYADTQQAINLAIFERFAQLGAVFAFPTRTVHIDTVNLPQPLALRGERSAQPETAAS